MASVVVIEMNPSGVRFLGGVASKATGFPDRHRSPPGLAVGYTLDEILNDITAPPRPCFEPTIDYVGHQRFRASPSRKFGGSPAVLSTSIEAVAREAMAHRPLLRGNRSRKAVRLARNRPCPAGGC